MKNCKELIGRYLSSKFRNLNKVIYIILLWQFGNNVIYFLYLKPSEVLRHSYGTSVLWMLTLEAMLSILSPLAGLVADIVYGRLRVLKFSTYLILACTIGVLLMSTLLTATQILILRYGLSTLLFGAYLGRVFFKASIVQFGTDQLRDMPTEKSVHFIHMYVWLHAVTYLTTSTVRINSHAYSLHNLITHTYTIVLYLKYF